MTRNGDLARPPSGGHRDAESARLWREELLLREWQIFFGYASHFPTSVPILEDVAKNLVEYGVAESAFVSDGQAWWNTEDPAHGSRVGTARKITFARVTMSLRTDRQGARVEFSKMPDGFAAETLYQAATLSFQEAYQFTSDKIHPRYVRAYLGKTVFIDNESQLVTYPQIKIFEDGVILVYFRVFSPADAQVLPRFLRRYVNAPLTGFRRVLAPPGIVYWSTLAAAEPMAFRWNQRIRTAWDQRIHRDVVEKAVEIHDDGDFSFAVAPISAPTEAALLQTTQEMLEELLTEESDKLTNLLTNEDSLRQAVMEIRQPDEPIDKAADRLASEMSRKFKARAKIAGQAATEAAKNIVEKQQETFSGIALTIMAVVGFVSGGKRVGARSLLRLALEGPGPIAMIGDHWGGHHHINLIRFRNQSPSALENERAHGAAFGSIVARTEISDPAIARSFLPKSLRLFDDFGAYVALNGTLWVHSRTSLRTDSDFKEPNQGPLIYEHQAKAELLDYVYALHRRISEQARASTASLDEIFVAQYDLANFELALHDSSHFGEIRDLIHAGLDAYGIRAFRDRIGSVIRVRENMSRELRGQITARLGIVISLVAGLLAVPALGSQVVSPIWTIFGWPSLGSDAATRLVQVALAATLVAGVVLVGAAWAAKRHPRAHTSRAGSEMAR